MKSPIGSSQDWTPIGNGASYLQRWTYHMVSSWDLCGDSLNKTAVAATSCWNTLGGTVPEFSQSELVFYTVLCLSHFSDRSWHFLTSQYFYYYFYCYYNNGDLRVWFIWWHLSQGGDYGIPKNHTVNVQVY